MEENENQKQSLPYWRKIIFAMIIIAMSGLASLMLWSSIVGKQLGNEIRRIKDTDGMLTFADLRAATTNIVPQEDAAKYYRNTLASIPIEQATKLTNITNLLRRSIHNPEEGKLSDEILKSIRADVAQLKPVLDIFDRAAALPISRYELGLEKGRNVCSQNVSRIQMANLYLSLRTLSLIADQKPDAAARSATSMLRLARVMDAYPIGIVHASKSNLILMACDDIYLMLQHTSPSQRSLEWLQRVLTEAMPDDILEKVILTERIYHTESVRNLVPESVTLELLPDDNPDFADRWPLPGPSWRRLRSRKRIIDTLGEIQIALDACRKPWPETLNVLIATNQQTPSTVIAAAEKLAKITAGTLAAIRTEILMIAIERYRLTKRKLPDSLTDIVPQYIDAIPIDPYTGNQLLYTKDDTGYSVYSLGSNRLDDNATFRPATPEIDSPDVGFRLDTKKAP